MSDQQNDQLHAMRHSLAHITAAAIRRLWPDAKFGVGPVVENGFYYDVDLGDKQLSNDNFGKIEKEMKKIIDEGQPFEKFYKPIDEAIAWAQEAKQPYKLELLNDLKRAGTTIAKDINAEELGLESQDASKVDEVSFYKNGDFIDLCRGPHVASTGEVGAFKLMRVSGAYWRGKEDNQQMQRVYGVAFPTQEELDKYLAMLEEAKKRDHRKLGQELDLFVFSDLVGPGLPLWTPRGTVLRKELDRFVQELRDQMDFQEVAIPHITKRSLYERSGHWAKFADELFHITTREGHEFAMKPMNCPHHTQIYASRPRSYRDLPIRYRETTMCYRDEQSGELNGLSRVRAFTQDDAHIFCREDQTIEEVMRLWQIIQDFYGQLDFPLSLRFSSRDPKKLDAYVGDPELWDKAEQELRDVVAKQKDMDIESEGIGEAAFYGPKLDFMAKDSLGRQWQVATIQIDYGQPQGLDLKYTDISGVEARPVMIHCAVMGSIERFLSVYIEHTAGRFPVWVAPEQVRVITVNQEDATVRFARQLSEMGKALGLRLYIDNDNESVGKKIRNAELMKVPYTVVIGEKEIESGRVVPRVRKDIEVSAEHDPHTVEEFLKTVMHETKSRVTKTSL
ncbi:MAG TPA: threonine--tRNA ligase [Candidatus Saccharimonadales bacterium]|nr:threonine--tRNA ligase [Candidatus Saccharimonadales bacterium]